MSVVPTQPSPSPHMKRKTHQLARVSDSNKYKSSTSLSDSGSQHIDVCVCRCVRIRAYHTYVEMFWKKGEDPAQARAKSLSGLRGGRHLRGPSKTFWQAKRITPSSHVCVCVSVCVGECVRDVDGCQEQIYIIYETPRHVETFISYTANKFFAGGCLTLAGVTEFFSEYRRIRECELGRICVVECRWNIM